MGIVNNGIFRDEYWISRGGGLLINYVGEPLASEMDLRSLKALLRRKRALGAMWNYDLDYTSEGTWYRCICDRKDYGIDSIQSDNVKHNLRRSLKRCQVREVDLNWLVDNGYQVYLKATERFSGHVVIHEDVYKKELRVHAAMPGRKAVGVFVEGVLVAYATLIVCDGIVFGDTAFFNPMFSSAYPMYALYFTIARDSLAAGYVAFDRGTKPLLHETGIDDFLLRLGFRLSYCRLGLFMRPFVAPAVKVASRVVCAIPSLSEGKSGRSLLALAEAIRIASETRQLSGIEKDRGERRKN